MKKTSQKRQVTGFEAIEQALGHSFSKSELLQHALTHSSHANELTEENSSIRQSDNEQMEFLGDAVLGFVTSRALFDRYPGYSEGQLSKTRAHLVSARHLVKVARGISLGTHLRLGRGEERSGGRSKSALLVDALEAVIAAIYLDAGLEAARRFVLEKIVTPELEMLDKHPGVTFADQKSALQEYLQSQGGLQPSYQVAGEAGPDHRKTFTVELHLTPAMLGRETGYVCRAQATTKKGAEQKAAQQALRYLKKNAVQ
jgi:ribonuclease-3